MLAIFQAAEASRFPPSTFCKAINKRERNHRDSNAFFLSRACVAMNALREVADELVNTPTVCRKSYVLKAVVLAFENGVLEKLSRKNGNRSGPGRREAMLAQLLGRIAA